MSSSSSCIGSCVSISVSNNIQKRFYPGGNKPPIGHAHKILNSFSNKMPPASSSPILKNQGPNIVPTKKPVETDPTQLYNMQQDAVPFNKISSQIIDKTSIYTKMKDTALKMIPSIRPYNSEKKITTTTLDNMTLQGKEAMAMFLNYFPQLPEEFVKDPRFLMIFHKYLTENHSEILVRAYQLCLEVCYNKKAFSEQELRDIFENKFTIIDFLGKNIGITDASTFFSVLQANHLQNQPGFTKAVDTAIVIATSPTTGDLKNLSPQIRKRIEEITKATGNTINDIDLNGHPYDFKITYDPHYARNHIMFISPDNDKIQFE